MRQWAGYQIRQSISLWHKCSNSRTHQKNMPRKWYSISRVYHTSGLELRSNNRPYSRTANGMGNCRSRIRDTFYAQQPRTLLNNRSYIYVPAHGSNTWRYNNTTNRISIAVIPCRSSRALYLYLHFSNKKIDQQLIYK